MFVALNGSPRILRFYGQGTIVLAKKLMETQTNLLNEISKSMDIFQDKRIMIQVSEPLSYYQWNE
jgi:hypothetical protein